jgi:hypothetical protein
MTSQMFDEYSDEELDRIERLSDAATQGPWFSYVVGRDTEAESNCIEVGTCNELGSCKCIEVVGGTVADQDFIASARQDVPRLLLEVRVLRARLDSLRDLEIRSRSLAVPGVANPTAPLLSSM